MSDLEATVRYHRSNGQHVKTEMLDQICTPAPNMFLCTLHGTKLRK